LLDNHQVEFAEVMAKMEYAVHGHLEYAVVPYLSLDFMLTLAPVISSELSPIQKHYENEARNGRQ
jgi:UDP-N-acetylglucosamine transferase subunit ALG13